MSPPPVDVLTLVVEAGAAPGQAVVVRRGAGRVLDPLVGEGEHTRLLGGVSPADGGGGAGGGGQDDDQQEESADAEGRGRQGPQAPLVQVTEVDLNKPWLVLPLPQFV